jgi:NAD(P)-dependent dehydrogenase (short-subunit alcohol dehydrogenase family)
MLSGKVCLVSGSTAGIGKGIAAVFLSQGAFVFINGRSASNVNQVLSEFRSKSWDQVNGIVADISTAEGCELLFNEIDKSGKVVDVLVNNMGIFETRDFFQITDEQWMNYFNVNVISTVRLCRRFLKPMLDRNSGRIIVVSSEAGMRPIPDMIHYSSTKSAQINIARGLAELTKGTNVTVNSLLPGPTSTEGLLQFIDGIATSTGVTREEASRRYFAEREPTSLLQRFLTVEEVANVALFLASDLSSGINGAAQLVDGGVIRSV